MSEPQRIQLRRTKGWRKPEGAVVVARPSKWGNPYSVRPAVSWPYWAGPRPSVVVDPQGLIYDPPLSTKVIVGRAAAERSMHLAAVRLAVEMYRDLITSAHMADSFLTPLAGHDLACWCPLDQPCHADVLLELANGGAA